MRGVARIRVTSKPGRSFETVVYAETDSGELVDLTGLVSAVHFEHDVCGGIPAGVGRVRVEFLLPLVDVEALWSNVTVVGSEGATSALADAAQPVPDGVTAGETAQVRGSSEEEHRPHKPTVEGSNPSPATTPNAGTILPNLGDLDDYGAGLVAERASGLDTPGVKKATEGGILPLGGESLPAPQSLVTGWLDIGGPLEVVEQSEMERPLSVDGVELAERIRGVLGK